MRKKIDDLATEEKRLDNEILALNHQLKEEYLQNDHYSQYHYITFEDCAHICRNICKADTNKGMLVLTAPKGTKLELGEEDRGECHLKMDTDGKGVIKAFYCKVSEGVKQLNLLKKEE